MPAREQILHKVRTALGRSTDQPPEETPPVWLCVPEMESEERVRRMLANFPGTAIRAASPGDAREYVAGLAVGRRAVISRAPDLDRLGIAGLPGVQVAPGDPAAVKEACAAADIGVTTAEYGMCDTGALVVLASSRESRLASLLPTIHVTVLPAERILTGLDELFTVMPDPGAVSSSMVLIGGPSKTADIEQILTLGVHGPREIHLVIV
jgi:L-lactate dehydrogenase complex protein LldG